MTRLHDHVMNHRKVMPRPDEVLVPSLVACCVIHSFSFSGTCLDSSSEGATWLRMDSFISSSVMESSATAAMSVHAQPQPIRCKARLKKRHIRKRRVDSDQNDREIFICYKISPLYLICICIQRGLLYIYWRNCVAKWSAEWMRRVSAPNPVHCSLHVNQRAPPFLVPGKSLWGGHYHYWQRCYVLALATISLGC